MAPYCAIPRDYLSDTLLACALWGFWCLNMANWVRYPPPFPERFPPGDHAKWRCDPPPPHKTGISAILARYPMKTMQNTCDTPLCDLCDTASRIGPLSARFYCDLNSDWNITRVSRRKKIVAIPGHFVFIFLCLGQEKVRKRGGVQKSMGDKVLWKTGMLLIYLPVTYLATTHFPAERSSCTTL